MRVGVINYNAGNLRSVESALRYLDADYFISSHPDELLRADKLIFPGVGEASFAMKQLSSNGCDEMLKEFATSGKPLFGICLGAQILFTKTEEKQTQTLGILKGTVEKFSPSFGLKIPHMGWNNVLSKEKSKLFQSIEPNSSFYFVHSFFLLPEKEKDISATTDYGIQFCSAIESSNIFAAQFHPEKSGKCGLQMLTNFLSI